MVEKETKIPSLKITVDGQAKPQGSKRGFINKRTGRITLVEASKGLKEWRGEASLTISQAATAKRWTKLEAHQPVTVVLQFGIKAPQKMVRELPTTKPDLDKQIRTILDAITQAENVWHDDSQVVVLTAAKFYEANPKTRIEIRYERLA